MKVRVLGCSGAIARDCRTTSFLIDGRILIDAGTGAGDLTLDEMQMIDHVFLTHSHLDHIAALPLMLDAVSSRRTQAVQIHALPETIAALQAHVFNNVIWPDFEAIPSQNQPLWVYSGDTGRNPAFWHRVNQISMAVLVIETAFSNRESALAERALHLSPHMLAEELAQLNPARPCPVYITHTKPLETELIMAEVRRFDACTPHGFDAPHDIRWLRAGDVLDL